jgi:hypothetical protein
MDAMFERTVESALLFLAGYAALGFLFALVFVSSGVTRVDPGTRGSSFAFRLLIIPGCTAFWPMLLWRWVTGRGAPLETNAHRRAAVRPR